MANKKKTTMTLKDFHGGSIPSDLPLPSAPSLSVRPPDRPGPWGAASSRPSDHHLLRPRPGSAGSASAAGSRGFDERPPPFLSNPAGIGRHFDEDERKPFEASSAPRRAPAPDPVRPGPSPPLAVVGSVVSDRSGAKRAVSFSPASGGAVPNAWGVRKEGGGENLIGGVAPVQWSASTIAQTSAVEKVLSGRWQSKPPQQADVEVIGFEEVDGLGQRFQDGVRVVGESDGRYREMERPRSGSAVVNGEVKNSSLQGLYFDHTRDKDRGRFGMNQGMKEQSAGYGAGAVRPASVEGRFSASKVQQLGSVEVQERPKLKLLPRSKQLESPDTHDQAFEDKQTYQGTASVTEIRTVKEMHENANASQVIEDEGVQAFERPKLNLKPRTQTVEQPNVDNIKERKTLFGGARPRELVLKERGVDVANEPDLIVQPIRNDQPKTESKLEPPMSNQPGERMGFPVSQKTGRDDKRGGHSPVADKVEATRASWRNDNRKNPRDIEKQLEQQRADVNNWRKPVEPPKAETPGLRFGKAASPLELAQAFSHSVSELKSDSNGANERNMPGRSQIPFSRLTDKREFYPRSAQKKINGH